MAQIETRGWMTRVRRVLRQRPALIVALLCCAVLALGVAVGAVALGSQASAGVLISRGTEVDVPDVAEREGKGGSAESAGDSERDARSGEDEASERIVVDVGGAVSEPQVVELDAGSRVADALDAAGGVTPDADLSAVNRAAPLADGQKVYIPHVGEAAAPAEVTSTGAAVTDAAAATGGSTLVNINTAGEGELDALPGIGPATAAAIVEDREANGPFATPEDLMRVSGIGEKKYAKLEGMICV